MSVLNLFRGPAEIAHGIRAGEERATSVGLATHPDIDLATMSGAAIEGLCEAVCKSDKFEHDARYIPPITGTGTREVLNHADTLQELINGQGLFVPSAPGPAPSVNIVDRDTDPTLKPDTISVAFVGAHRDPVQGALDGKIVFEHLAGVSHDQAKQIGEIAAEGSPERLLVAVHERKADGLVGVKMGYLTLKEPQLQECDMTEAVIRDVSITRGSFWQATLERAKLKITARKTSFESAHMEGATFEDGTRIEKCNFAGANLRGVKINLEQDKSIFRGCNVCGADLAGSSITQFIRSNMNSPEGRKLIVRTLKGMKWDADTKFSDDPADQAAIVAALHKLSHRTWFNDAKVTNFDQLDALLRQSAMRFVEFENGWRMLVNPDNRTHSLVYRAAPGRPDHVEVLHAPFLDDDITTRRVRPIKEVFDKFFAADPACRVHSAPTTP